MTEVIGVGIDLGTTNSSLVVCYASGRVQVVPSETGANLTPSYVAFEDDEEPRVGELAKSSAHLNPKNTVFEIKRVLGLPYDHPEVSRNQARWPFRLVRGSTGDVLVEVCQGSTTKFLTPVEISALILKSLVNTASTFLGRPVEKAVITVPAKFNDTQRRATLAAAKLAGLEVLALVNEPTSAALGYKDESIVGDKTFIVFDFGGGTLDISLVKCAASSQNAQDAPIHYQVIATEGDLQLGGADFDGCLGDHYIKIFHEKHQIDLRSNPEAVSRLKSQCESVKRLCSGGASGQASIASLSGGINFREKTTRAEFELLCGDLFQKLVSPIEKLLLDSSVPKSGVDFVLLVGGSTRMPKVKDVLREFFGPIPLKQNINPDEAIAVGAAVYAYSLMSGTAGGSQLPGRVVVTDIVPFSLGVEEHGGSVRRLIQKGQQLPVTVTQMFRTALEYAPTAVIKVYQGDAKRASESVFVGQITLPHLDFSRSPFVSVNFNYDVSGLLSVTVSDAVSGLSVTLDIKLLG